MSKLKEINLFEEIKWKLYFWKIRLPLFKYNIRDKYLRRKYCRYGFHHLTSGTLKIKKSGKRTVFIKYLNCNMCNYRFFARKVDKENFLKYDYRVNLSALAKSLK